MESVVRRSRAAFHDCVTVCDGCINITDSSNAGLADVVDALEVLWTGYVAADYPDLTRADFWAISAIAAINRGVLSSNRRCDKYHRQMRPSGSHQGGRVGGGR